TGSDACDRLLDGAQDRRAGRLGDLPNHQPVLFAIVFYLVITKASWFLATIAGQTGVFFRDTRLCGEEPSPMISCPHDLTPPRSAHANSGHLLASRLRMA